MLYPFPIRVFSILFYLEDDVCALLVFFMVKDPTLIYNRIYLMQDPFSLLGVFHSILLEVLSNLVFLHSPEPISSIWLFFSVYSLFPSIGSSHASVLFMSRRRPNSLELVHLDLIFLIFMSILWWKNQFKCLWLTFFQGPNFSPLALHC